MLDPDEREFVTRTATPERVQAFLDTLAYNWEPDGVSTLRSLRRVLRDREAEVVAVEVRFDRWLSAGDTVVFDVQFDVIEWNTLFTNWRKGAKDPSANGANAVNISFAAMDPFFAMVRFVSTKAFPPVSNNWGYYGNAEVDKLVADARTSFDDKTRDAALARLHQYIVDDAPFVWIAHDVGPRAMSPKVKNVVQPRSWFIDIATMTMD